MTSPDQNRPDLPSNTDILPPKVSETPRNAKVCISWVGAMVIALICSCVVSAAALKVYHDQWAIKVVTADVKSLIHDVREKYVSGEIDDREMEAVIDQLAVIVKNQRPGTIVIMKDVILSDNQELDINPFMAPQ